MRSPKSRIRGALLTLALIPSVSAAADPRPAGAEFALATCQTCREHSPSVAGTPSGAFATVWEGRTAADSHGLLARFFSIQGRPRSAERLVNRSLPPEQYDAAVAATTGNNYIVAWSEVDQGDSDVLVQRFKSTGAAIGAEIRVSVDDPASPGADYAPAVAATADGGFFVAWNRFVPPGDPDVWIRRYDPTGKPLTAPVRVSTGLVKGTAPDLCVATSGGPVVVWASIDERRPFEPSLEGVSLRRLSSAGAPLGTAEQVVLRPEAEAASAAVSCGRGNTFVVAYELDLAGVTDESDVFAQRFTRLGRPAAGAPLRVNTSLAGWQRTPEISHDSSGSFVLVWASSLDGDYGVTARRIGPTGVPLSGEVEVQRTDLSSRRPSSPDVAHAGKSGGFVVVWQDGTSAAYGRRFIP